MGGWEGGCVRGVAPRKFGIQGQEGREMGKMGDLGGNGEGRRRKSGGKEKIFLGEKFFIPREVHTMGATEYCY